MEVTVRTFSQLIQEGRFLARMATCGLELTASEKVTVNLAMDWQAEEVMRLRALVERKSLSDAETKAELREAWHENENLRAGLVNLK